MNQFRHEFKKRTNEQASKQRKEKGYEAEGSLAFIELFVYRELRSFSCSSGDTAGNSRSCFRFVGVMGTLGYYEN